MIGAALLERKLDAIESALMMKHILYYENGKACIEKIEDNNGCKVLVEQAHDIIFSVCFDNPSKAIIGYTHRNEPDRVWFLLVEEVGETVQTKGPISVKLDIPHEYLDDAITYLVAVPCGGDTAVASVISEVEIETDSGLPEYVPVYSAFIALKIGNNIEKFTAVRYNANRFRLYPYSIGCLNGICFFSAIKALQKKDHQHIIIAAKPMEVDEIKTIQLRDIVIVDRNEIESANNGFGAFTLTDGKSISIYTIDAMLKATYIGKIMGLTVGFNSRKITNASASWNPKDGIVAVIKTEDSRREMFWISEDGNVIKIVATEEPSLTGYLYLVGNDRLLISDAEPELFKLLKSRLVRKMQSF